MTEETTEIIASLPIYKPFRRVNFKLRKKLEKELSRMNPGFFSSVEKFDPVVEELNQFIFATMQTRLDDYHDFEVRKELEERLMDLYDKFGSKTLDKLRDLVAKDPEFVASYRALKDINDKTSVDISEQLDNLKNLPLQVRGQVRTLFKKSSMVLWDLPGDQIDRIIIGDEIMNIEDDAEGQLDIGTISDELALASIARHHVPLICDQVNLIQKRIEELSVVIGTFENSLNDFKDNSELNLTVEVASVFLGKLLGIREPLGLARKVLERYIELEDDIHQEALEMGSDLVESLYSRLVNRSEIDQSLKAVNQIVDSLNENSERIRIIYTRIEDSSPTGKTSSNLQNFANFVAEMYHSLEDFRFIIEIFQDIPSYTAMGGGSAVEIEAEEFKELKGDAIIYGEGIFKTFPLPTTTVYALRGIDLEIKRGEFVAIMGPSGSGKTTLLNILSGLEVADRGVVNVADLDLNKAKENQLVKFRRDTIAFIYQSYNLLPNFTNQENVQLPADLGTEKEIESKSKRSANLLEEVGIGEYRKGFPLRLSGGQQQRVTIARALMNKPDILFADEPTGDLDGHTGAQVMEIIEEFNKDGVTIVLVTHDKAIAERADRIINMIDGRIIQASEVQL